MNKLSAFNCKKNTAYKFQTGERNVGDVKRNALVRVRTLAQTQELKSEIQFFNFHACLDF